MSWSVIDLVIVGARGIGLTPPDRQAIGILVAARSVPNTEERIAYLPAPGEPAPSSHFQQIRDATQSDEQVALLALFGLSCRQD